MLAFVGYITVDMGNTWPSAPKVSSLLAHDEAVKNGNMLGLLLAIGILEGAGPNKSPAGLGRRSNGS